jgi:hypothetical protein
MGAKASSAIGQTLIALGNGNFASNKARILGKKINCSHCCSVKVSQQKGSVLANAVGDGGIELQSASCFSSLSIC